MPEHMLFHVVFLSQVLLVSFLLPRKVLGHMRYVFETYPPSNYPKLYPRPIEHYEKAPVRYRNLNLGILLMGLSILGVLLFYSRSGKWDHVIAMWYFLLQCLPLTLLDLSSLKESKLMRDASSRRTAELRRRRLPDFVSPTMLGVAIAVYLGFVVLVIYVRRLEFPWFGGYWNVFGVTLMNLFIARVIYRLVYGKKRNPHQAHEDRTRQIEIVAKVLVFVSVAATLFIALNVGLAALDLRSFQPVAQSLYFQLLAVACFQAYRIDYKNYEVYREDPLAT